MRIIKFKYRHRESVLGGKRMDKKGKEEGTVAQKSS